MPLFPRHKAFNQISTTEQVHRVLDECMEALGAIDEDNYDEECMDIIHAAETLRHNMINKLGTKRFFQLRSKVIEKNRKRGYYE